MKAVNAYKWAKTRKKGFLRYTVRYAPVLGLALIVPDLIRAILLDQLITEAIGASCFVGLVGGLLIAPLFWLSHEYQYKQWYDREFRR